jgi:hypothetical protein
MSAFAQFLRIVAFGLIAPARYPFGLAASSLPWLALTIAINVQVASHRSWTPFLGFGGQGWRYESYEHALLLRLGQALAAILFAAVWMGWVVRPPNNQLSLEGFLQRLLRVGWTLLKLSGIAIGVVVIWMVAGNMARAMTSDWYWQGALNFMAVMIAVSVWVGCRCVPSLASAALDSEPIGVRQSWRLTSGRNAWVFLAPLVPLLATALLKARLLQEIGQTIPMTFQHLIFDQKPLWKFAWQVDPVPLSMIVESVLVTWLQWTWLLATLALAYRYVRTPRVEGRIEGEPVRA